MNIYNLIYNHLIKNNKEIVKSLQPKLPNQDVNKLGGYKNTYTKTLQPILSDKFSYKESKIKGEKTGYFCRSK